jgi:hypothetical protein
MTNPYSPPHRRDTPTEVSTLYLCGFRRTVELDGIGMWEHDSQPLESWTGAEAALKFARAFYRDQLRNAERKVAKAAKR